MMNDGKGNSLTPFVMTQSMLLFTSLYCIWLEECASRSLPSTRFPLKLGKLKFHF